MRSLIRVAGATMIGKDHEKKRTICQDRVAVWRGKDKRQACIALSDGAGSSQYSHLGAATVVKQVIPMVQSQFRKFYEDIDFASSVIAGHLQSGLEEAAENYSVPYKMLACTLLFVFMERRRDKIKFVAGHVGDGVIVQESEGKATVLSHPSQGEFINTTEFVTSTDLPSRLRLYKGILHGRTGFMLMSDGTADTLYIRRKRDINHVFCKHIFNWCDRFPQKKIQRIITDNFQSGVFREVSRDDCSMALLRVL